MTYDQDTIERVSEFELFQTLLGIWHAEAYKYSRCKNYRCIHISDLRGRS